MSEAYSTKRLIEVLSGVLAAPGSSPGDEWVRIDRGVVSEAIESIDWLEKGNAEWRDEFQRTARQLRAERATVRVAVAHLEKLLNRCRNFADQQAADSSARDWLNSIGYSDEW